MRIVLLFLFFVFIQPAMAINKCEINGKVSYQTAGCPEHAKTKYLVNDKYIDEEQLRKYRQEKNTLSGSALKNENVPEKHSIDTTDSQVEEVDEQGEKADNHTAPHVNVPRAFDYVNPKLENMDRKLEQHNKKLQQLQNAE